MSSEQLARLPVGVVCRGDEVFYRRKFDSGWIKVSSVDPQLRWVNGYDTRHRARSIKVEQITRIKRKGATL